MYILTQSHSFDMLMVIAVVVNTVKRPSRVLFCFVFLSVMEAKRQAYALLL